MSAIFKRVSNPVSGLTTIAIALLLASRHQMMAQATQAGFFSIANAVDLQTNTVVSVDGKPLRPDGLKPSKVTGGLGFPVGSHRVDATNDNCKPVSLSLQLTPSTSPIVIIYLAEVKSTTGQVARELRMFSKSNAPPANKKTFSVIYTGQAALKTIAFNNQSKALRPLQEVALGSVPSISIAEAGQPVGNFSPEGPGNYLIVLFDAPGSRLGSVLAEDLIFRQAGQR